MYILRKVYEFHRKEACPILYIYIRLDGWRVSQAAPTPTATLKCFLLGTSEFNENIIYSRSFAANRSLFYVLKYRFAHEINGLEGQKYTFYLFRLCGGSAINIYICLTIVTLAIYILGALWFILSPCIVLLRLCCSIYTLYKYIGT